MRRAALLLMLVACAKPAPVAAPPPPVPRIVETHETVVPPQSSQSYGCFVAPFEPAPESLLHPSTKLVTIDGKEHIELVIPHPDGDHGFVDVEPVVSSGKAVKVERSILAVVATILPDPPQKGAAFVAVGVTVQITSSRGPITLVVSASWVPKNPQAAIEVRAG